jgi:hypothetical protein
MESALFLQAADSTPLPSPMDFNEPRFLKHPLREWVRRGFPESQGLYLLTGGLTTLNTLIPLFGIYATQNRLHERTENEEGSTRYLGMDPLMRELFPNPGFNPDRFERADMLKIFVREMMTREELKEQLELESSIVKRKYQSLPLPGREAPQRGLSSIKMSRW